MNFHDLIRLVAQACDANRLEYFLVGSVASSYYGEIRNTNDVDVVVELPSWHVRSLCACFPQPDFYVDEDAVMHAARHAGQFNINVPSAGLKIDFMVMDDRPFNESRRSRARLAEIADGLWARVAAPEDVILMKLVYYNDGASEKHLRDITTMLNVSRDEIDLAYLEKWVERLGVPNGWKAVLQKMDAVRRGEAPPAGYV